ncbi:MAG TPA: carboxypeptidase-like regulatory domain-containing protein, partial [Bacteroidales bacterium]|nr:carboxypeptidase-like regulatory domain-containing protein [Bacteroidales bacterium]
MIKNQRTLYLLIFSLLPVMLWSQDYGVSGKVIDSKTKEPLAFVNIVINSGLNGGTTDIDGKFRLRYHQKIQYLNLSYVCYIPQRITVGDKTTDLVLLLTPTEIELSEVEILPGVNPAHRIIRNAVDNREINDPEKLKSFSYTAYDKTIFTVDKDTIRKDSLQTPKSGLKVEFTTKNDSIRSDSAMKDTVDKELRQFLDRQNLFLMENVTKRKFLAPDKSYNQVIATRMSGFKDPIFVFLTTQIQSFSFYKPFITIFQST